MFVRMKWGAIAMAMLLASAGAASATTILRGSPPRQPPPYQQYQQLPPPEPCPDGYFYAQGNCYPYSWNGATTPW